MLVKNFFGERLELPDEALGGQVDGPVERIKASLEEQFGIPTECQRIFMSGHQLVLSVHQSEHWSCTTEVTIPDELKDLGASQEDFNYFYNQCHDLEATKRHLFPFISAKERQRYAFEDVQKGSLEDVDEHIRSMPEARKGAILKNLEAYIGSFIDSG